MFLWCSSIYVCSGTLVTLLPGFLRCYMPPWRSGITDPYMWLDIDETKGGEHQLISLASQFLID